MRNACGVVVMLPEMSIADAVDDVDVDDDDDDDVDDDVVDDDDDDDEG